MSTRFGRSRPRLRRRALALVAGLSLAVGLGHPPALADPVIGTNPLQSGAMVPAGLGSVDAATYTGLFGSQGDAAPTGVVVSDSGFRPFPNGFSFVNYGSNQRGNQLLFGQPVPLAAGKAPVPSVGMNAASMRRVFGDGVCTSLTPSTTSGTCALTESAKVVMALADTWAASGHCFGMSTVATALFTGQLPATSLRAGLVNTLTTLSPEAQRTIMRAFIAQYFSAKGFRPASMTDAISRLRAGIVPSKLPYTLLLYGAPGGHALTPFAILDRGNGLFDIAVYDSNIPNQMRAVHVDTAANSWAYDGSTTAGSQERTWSSADATKPATMLLGLVDTALGRQECTFCRAKDSRTLVSFSPVVSANGAVYDSIAVYDKQGLPLDPALHEMILPTNDASAEFFNGPVLLVDEGIGFSIRINGQGAHAAQPFVVTIVSSGDTHSVSLRDLNPDLSGLIAVEPVGNSLVFRGASVHTVKVTQTYETAGTSYRFAGEQSTGSTQADVRMRTSGTQRKVIFRDMNQRDSSWNLQMRSSTKSSTARFHAQSVKVAKGDQLVVTYVEWHGTKGRPALWLDRHSNGTLDTRLPLVKG